ncbi:MAG: carbohydrate-binding protein [Bacillota bacterium]
MTDPRVWTKPSLLSKGIPAEIGYRGLLVNSGADRVFLHYGKDGWQNLRTTEMKRRIDGSFSASIMPEGDKCIDLCFRDSAGNWDNNSGSDWHLRLRK